MAELVHVNVLNRVATLTIDHPPVNALASEVLTALDAALSAALADASVRAIVISGSGDRAFVAGANIKAFEAQINGGEAGLDAMRAYLAQGQALFTRIEQSPVPVIAAINGVALGGGMELALACHLRLAAPTARLGQPEINLGLIPAWGGTQRLPRLVGQPVALHMILTGDAITADQALALGLVNSVAADVRAEAQALGEKLAAKGASAIQAALRAVRASQAMRLEDGLALEVNEAERLFETPDLREGVEAFLQKRQARFA